MEHASVFFCSARLVRNSETRGLCCLTKLFSPDTRKINFDHGWLPGCRWSTNEGLREDCLSNFVGIADDLCPEWAFSKRTHPDEER